MSLEGTRYRRGAIQFRCFVNGFGNDIAVLLRPLSSDDCNSRPFSQRMVKYQMRLELDLLMWVGLSNCAQISPPRKDRS